MQENGALRDLGRTALSGKFSPSSKWLSRGLSAHIVAKVISLFYLCCDDLLCGYLGSRGLKGFGMGVEPAEEDEIKVESSVMAFNSETYEKWVPSPRQTSLCSPWKDVHGSYQGPSQEQCGVESRGETSWFQVVSEQREWLDGFNLSNGRWFLAEKGLLLCYHMCTAGLAHVWMEQQCWVWQSAFLMLGSQKLRWPAQTTSQNFMTEVIDTDHVYWRAGSTLYQLCFWEVPWLARASEVFICRRYNNTVHVQRLQIFNKTVLEM